MPSSSAPPLTDAELDRLYDQEPSDSRTARSVWWQKGIARCKQNPFVPIAMGATVFALWGAVRSMNRADRVGLQKMLRYRVYAQGAAIGAMVIGGVVYDGKTPIKDFREKLPKELKQAYGQATAPTNNPSQGINFSPSRRGERSAPSPTDQPHHTPHDPVPAQPAYKAPPTLVAGKKGSKPTVADVTSEFAEDADWKATDDKAELSRKERRQRQVEEFLAKREESQAEGRRKEGGTIV